MKPKRVDLILVAAAYVAGVLLPCAFADGTEGSVYVPQDQHTFMTAAGALQVSTQAGYYSVVETDLSLPGKNGYDLRITRRYDLNAARREEEKRVQQKLIELAPAERAYSVGMGWRLDLPFVQVMPDAPAWPDVERERSVYITLPSGARYSLWDMSLIDTSVTGRRVYANIREVSFRMLVYTSDNTYKLVMADGTIYSINAIGLVTRIDGRAPDGRRGGAVLVAYGGDNLITTITDTRGRVLNFSYTPEVGGLKAIARIDVSTDALSLSRRIVYTYDPGTRNLLHAELIGGSLGSELSHAWSHLYGTVRLSSRSGWTLTTVDLPCLQEVSDWRGGRATIMETEVQPFSQRGGNYRDALLVREVQEHDRVPDENGVLQERLAAEVYLHYTTGFYDTTSETYVAETLETRRDVIGGLQRVTNYDFETRTEIDSSGQTFVHTKPWRVKTLDPSGMSDYLYMTQYDYYDDVWKVKEIENHWSANEFQETTYSYDSFGNTECVETVSTPADRQTRQLQWTKYWGATYYDPLQDDAPWIGWFPYNPPYPTDFLQPMNLPAYSIAGTYYPYWSGSQIVNYSASQVEYLHTAYNYDTTGQKIATKQLDDVQQELETTYTYFDDGRPQQITTPGSLRTTYDYDPDYRTDLELVTVTRKDPRMEPDRKVLDAEATGELAYQIVTESATDIQTGWTKWSMSGRGYVTEYSYDIFGRTTQVVLPDVNDTDDDPHTPPEDPGFAMTRANNPRVTVEYNDTALWVQTTDPEDRVSCTLYASFLKPASTMSYIPGGQNYTEVVTDFEYNGWDQLVARREPANGTGGSYSGQRTTTYEYDVLGNPTRQVHPDGEQILWVMDYATGLVTMTNERGYASDIQLDFGGAILQVTEYDGGANRTYARHYDGAGKVRIDVDAKDNKIQRFYTVLGQLKRIDFPKDPQWPFFEFNEELFYDPQPYFEYEYSPDGVLVRNITKVAGDTTHAIEHVVDVLGRCIERRVPYSDDTSPPPKTATTLFAYDADGNTIDVVDPNNAPLDPAERKHLRLAYSPAGTLLNRTDAEEHRTDFSYHADGRLATETDPRGTSGEYPDFPGTFVRTYEFDELGRLASVEYPIDIDGVTQPTVAYTYYPSGTIATTTTPDGGLLTYWYTPRSWRQKETASGDGRSYSTLYYYDEVGNCVQTVNPAGAVVAREFDGWNRIVQSIQPEGNSEQWEYDVNDKVTLYIDGEGNPTSLEYDRYDRVKRLHDAKEQDTLFWYDRLGTLTKVEDPTERVVTFAYDELGRLRDQWEAGRLRHYQYDAVGNLRHATDPRGTTADYGYDGNNRLVNVVRTNGAQTESVELLYDVAGLLKRVSEDGVVSEYNLTGSDYLPDPYGRIRGERTAVEGQTLSVDYSYDTTGRVTGVRGPDAAWVTYQYNRVGELKQIPGFVDQDVTYTQAGYPELAVLSNGVSLSWRFDLNGRLVGKDYADAGGGSVKSYDFLYDRADNLTWKNDTYFEYDRLNQLVRERRSETLERREPLGPIGVVRGDLLGGQNKGLETFHTGSELIELDYHAGSIGVDLGAAVNVSRVEILPSSPVHRVGTRHLSVWTSTGGAYTQASEWYIKKKAGGIIEIVFLTPVALRYLKIHCTFDERDIDLAPVSAAQFSNTADQILRVYTTTQVVSEDSFDYDDAGNRVTEILTEGGVPQAYQSLYYSGTHRLKANDRWGYQYDANGNMVKKGASYTVNGDEVIIDTGSGEWWEYVYDLADRLTAVSHNGTWVATYRYDAWGRRVRRTGTGVTTYYAFDQWDRVIYERTGDEYRDHVYAFGERLARVDGTISGETHSPAAKYFYHSDHIGTVEAMTDESGAVVWQASYTAFGVVTGQSGSIDAPPVFAGKTLDEATGLYYFNARWYDPSIGRFITEDPAMDGLNWYVYVRNNPMRYLDPTGLDAGPKGPGGYPLEDRSSPAVVEDQSDSDDAQPEPAPVVLPPAPNERVTPTPPPAPPAAPADTPPPADKPPAVPSQPQISPDDMYPPQQAPPPPPPPAGDSPSKPPETALQPPVISVTESDSSSDASSALIGRVADTFFSEGATEQEATTKAVRAISAIVENDWTLPEDVRREVGLSRAGAALLEVGVRLPLLHGETLGGAIQAEREQRIAEGWGAIALAAAPLGMPTASGAKAAARPSGGVTYLYQKVGPRGEHLKFGVSKNPATRYTSSELAGGRLRVLAVGERSEMLRLERNLHNTLPIGPQEAQSMYIGIQASKGYRIPPY